jgi:hypothetical protein|nr:hypothetical protein [Neorhizobium tomejilense]
MTEPEFKLWDRHHLLPLVSFADIESSGLHEGSFPLQFGWCGLDLKTSVVLVKPEPQWTPDLYDDGSFEIHGIPYETAVAEGLPAREVAAILNRELAGKAVFSDSDKWDSYWAMKLAEATDIPLRFGLDPFDKVIETFGPVADSWCITRYHRILEAVDIFYPHTHRADEDAQRMAALTRMILDREWCEWLLERQAGIVVG